MDWTQDLYPRAPTLSIRPLRASVSASRKTVTLLRPVLTARSTRRRLSPGFVKEARISHARATEVTSRRAAPREFASTWGNPICSTVNRVPEGSIRVKETSQGEIAVEIVTKNG